MAPHSSTLAWKIPWMEEPGRLQSMGSLRVRYNWATSLFTFHFHALEKEMATHSSVIAWRIPGMGEHGGLLSVGLSHDWSDLAAAAVLGPVKVKKKKKLGMFRSAHSSLYLLFFQERERKKLILLFSFSLQQKVIFSSRGFKFSDWHRTQTLKRGAKKDKLTVNSRIKPMILSSLGIC